MSFDLTNKNIKDTFQNLLQRTGSNNQLYDLTGNEIGDIRISGSLIAQQYIVSSSVTNVTFQQQSGSTIFGDSADDTITKKPMVTVSQVKNHFNPVEEMVTVLKENGITLKTVVKDKQKIAPILGNYSKNVGYVGGIKKFISEVIKKLSKE